MALYITGTFGFADYESGGKRGSDTDSHLGCIINLLLIHFLFIIFINLIYYIINFLYY